MIRHLRDSVMKDTQLPSPSLPLPVPPFLITSSEGNHVAMPWEHLSCLMEGSCGEKPRPPASGPVSAPSWKFILQPQSSLQVIPARITSWLQPDERPWTGTTQLSWVQFPIHRSSELKFWQCFVMRQYVTNTFLHLTEEETVSQWHEEMLQDPASPMTPRATLALAGSVECRMTLIFYDLGCCFPESSVFW